MPWEPEHNIRSLSPHGIKGESFAPRQVHDINCVPGPEPPPGFLSMEPLGAGVSSPYMPTPPAAREVPRR
jgi:hypothetical protein